jgi:hypothetical protein
MKFVVIKFGHRQLNAQGKSPRVPPYSRSGRCEVEKNILPLQEMKPRPIARHYTDWTKINFNIILHSKVGKVR